MQLSRSPSLGDFSTFSSHITAAWPPHQCLNLTARCFRNYPHIFLSPSLTHVHYVFYLVGLFLSVSFVSPRPLFLSPLKTLTYIYIYPRRSIPVRLPFPSNVMQRCFYEKPVVLFMFFFSFRDPPPHD